MIKLFETSSFLISVKVSGIKFKSLTCFQLISVSGIRSQLNCHYFTCEYPVFPGLFVEEIIFFPSCVQELLSKTSCPHKCRFISGVSIFHQHICLLYASTILLLLHNFVICFETRQHLYEARYIMFTKYINLTGGLSYLCVPSFKDFQSGD